MGNEQTNAAQSSNNAADVKPGEATVSTEAKNEGAKTETKSEPTKAEPSKAEGSKESTVPEKYELTIPEGSELDDGALEKIQSYAKEKGLSNEQAQELLNREHEAIKSYAEQQSEALKMTNETEWKQELMKDPEVGGTDFEKNGQLAVRAAEKFFGAGFAEELKAMNLNHHPRLFKGFVRIGRAMADADLVIPEGKGSAPKSIEERLYGSKKQ